MSTSLRIVSVYLACGLTLSGCIKTEQLYAVRQYPIAKIPTQSTVSSSTPYNEKHNYGDDRPGLYQSNQNVKASFRKVATDQCDGTSLKNAQPGQTTSTWAAANKFSYSCVSRIAAYTIDQCVALSLAQNRFAGTTKLFVGTALVAAALATDGVALASPNDPNKTAISALGVAVTANGGGISGLVPAIVQPPVANIIAAGLAYAEVVGITDFDFTGATPLTEGTATAVMSRTESTTKPETTRKADTATKLPVKTKAKASIAETRDETITTDDVGSSTDFSTTTTITTPALADARVLTPSFMPPEPLILKLARTHDAMLSQCTADKIGFGPMGRP